MGTDMSLVGKEIRLIAVRNFKGAVKVKDGSPWRYVVDEDSDPVHENWFRRDYPAIGIVEAPVHFYVRGFDEEGSAHVRLIILHPLDDSKYLYHQKMACDRDGMVTMVEDERNVDSGHVSAEEIRLIIQSIADDLVE